MFGKKKLKKELESYKKENRDHKKKIKELEKIVKKYKIDIAKTILKIKEKEKGEVKLPQEWSKLIDILEKDIYEEKKDKNELETSIRNLKRELSNIKERHEVTVKSEQDINIPNRSEIEGGVVSEHNLVIGESSTINGKVKATQNITIGKDVVIKENITSTTGQISVEDGVNIEGILTGGTVEVGKKVLVKKIRADGDVTLGEGSKTNKITAVGDVNMKKESVVEGILEYGGSFDGDDGIEVKGSLTPKEKEKIKEKLSKYVETSKKNNDVKMMRTV